MTKNTKICPVLYDAPTGLAARMARGDLMNAACPSREVLKHLTGRWAVLALIALEPGTRRFSDLRRTIPGVSERMLALTLQRLEADGMLVRKDYRTVPPHVDYTLTERGRQASEKVQALADWIEEVLPEIMEHWAANESNEDVQ